MIEEASINVNGLMEGDENAFQALFIDYYSVRCIREDMGNSGKVGWD